MVQQMGMLGVFGDSSATVEMLLYIVLFRHRKVEGPRVFIEIAGRVCENRRDLGRRYDNLLERLEKE